MLHRLHEFIWGPEVLVLFLAVGILYSVRLSLFPVLGFPIWMKNTVGNIGRAPQDGRRAGISSFQSACTALAATIGTGNIAGVATALLAGGPGSVFWMWISAALGMATAYGETELGIRYRRKDRKGSWMSGAMLYLEYGLGSPESGLLYAALCVAASFGMGSMVQANAISETLEFAFSVPPVVSGAGLAVLIGSILVGGAELIARTAERMVPVSAGIYLAASAAVLVIFREQLPGAFRLILSDAFSFRSAAGGAAGFGVSACVRYGIARGVFSNEAGLGSLAALNGGVWEAEPGVQGQWAIFEVFFDTIVSCTLTALVILCAVEGDPGSVTDNGAALTGLCFSRALGSFGGYVVSVCVALFAFATIIAWYYMGRQAAEYLGEKAGVDASKLYLAGYLTAVFLGCLSPMEAVWEISDIMNGMMALPNLLALLLLVRQVERPPCRRE